MVAGTRSAARESSSAEEGSDTEKSLFGLCFGWDPGRLEEAEGVRLEEADGVRFAEGVMERVEGMEAPFGGLSFFCV